MTAFVLDNSVAMRWRLTSNKVSDQKYAELVLRSMVSAEALVPNLWHLEAANVLLQATNRNDITFSDLEDFTVQLESLPIAVDPLTANQVFGHTVSLARTCRLSIYDAAYLELAFRESLPLATLDKDLLKAARKAGIPLYLK